MIGDPVAVREALLVEAIGDLANLIDAVQELKPVLQGAGRDIAQAEAGLRDSLATFEARMTAVTEHAKVQAMKHVAMQTHHAAKLSIEQQSRAMSDAARLAFGTQLGASMERLQAMLRPLADSRQSRWETRLMYFAVAATASAGTWLLMVLTGRG